MKRALYAVLAIVVVASAVIVGVRVKERVGEGNIEVATEAEVDRQMDMVKKNDPEAFKGKKGKKAAEVARKAIEDQVRLNALIREEAKARGIVPSQTEIDTAIAQVRAAYGGEKKFQAALKASGMTVETYEERIGDQLTVSKMMSAISGEAKVTNAEARAYYKENIDKFSDKHDPSASKSYSQVEDVIKKRLLEQKQAEEYTEFIEELKKRL